MCLPIKPYKIEREWEFAGLKCAVVQAREGQHRCGYVRIPPTHPLHGKAYDDVDVEIHGGLTFAQLEPCAHEDGTGWWFGFDCAHCYDASIEPELNPNWDQGTKRIWEIHQEFKSADEHFWLQSEVERETERLAQQLAAQPR